MTSTCLLSWSCEGGCLSLRCWPTFKQFIQWETWLLFQFGGPKMCCGENCTWTCCSGKTEAWSPSAVSCWLSLTSGVGAARAPDQCGSAEIPVAQPAQGWQSGGTAVEEGWPNPLRLPKGRSAPAAAALPARKVNTGWPISQPVNSRVALLGKLLRRRLGTEHAGWRQRVRSPERIQPRPLEIRPSTAALTGSCCCWVQLSDWTLLGKYQVLC